MLLKTIKISIFLLLLNAFPANANISLTSRVENQVSNLSFDWKPSFLSRERYSIKKGEGYDKSNDPIFHANGPESTTPEHGYFAVPLIVIGIAGILLYFSKND